MSEQQFYSPLYGLTSLKKLAEAGIIIPKKVYPVNERHKDIVEDGGGVYVSGMMGTLVLFNSPQTGSTLAVEEKDLTPEAVRARIEESNATFASSTHVRTL